MDTFLIAFLICMTIMIILYALGKEAWLRNISCMYSGTKDYIGAALCPIGFGLMRLVPRIKKLHISGTYYIFASRYDEKNEIDAHWNMVLSQLITFFFVGIAELLLMSEIIAGSYGMDSVREVIPIFFIPAVLMEVHVVRIVSTKDKLRVEQIIDDLPELLNRLVIMLNSGIPIAMAFSKIGRLGGDRPLDEELQKVILDFTNHGDIVYALGRMQRRCHCAEVSRLCAIVDHSANKGASDSTASLTNLTLELWEEKRHNVRKKGTRLGEKLMLPTVLLFIIVIVYSVAPMLFKLKNFKL